MSKKNFIFYIVLFSYVVLLGLGFAQANLSIVGDSNDKLINLIDTSTPSGESNTTANNSFYWQGYTPTTYEDDIISTSYITYSGANDNIDLNGRNVTNGTWYGGIGSLNISNVIVMPDGSASIAETGMAIGRLSYVGSLIQRIFDANGMSGCSQSNNWCGGNDLSRNGVVSISDGIFGRDSRTVVLGDQSNSTAYQSGIFGISNLIPNEAIYSSLHGVFLTNPNRSDTVMVGYNQSYNLYNSSGTWGNGNLTQNGTICDSNGCIGSGGADGTGGWTNTSTQTTTSLNTVVNNAGTFTGEPSTQGVVINYTNSNNFVDLFINPTTTKTFNASNPNAQYLLRIQNNGADRFYVRYDGVLFASNELRNGAMTQTTQGVRWGTPTSYMQLGGVQGSGAITNSAGAEIDLNGNLDNTHGAGDIIFRAGNESIIHQPEIARFHFNKHLGESQFLVNATNSNFTGTITANDYYSGDGTQGMTGTCASTTTLTIKDGLITACS